MNKYLNNIDNLNKDETSAKAPVAEPIGIDGETPILSAPPPSPQVTGPKAFGAQGQDRDDEIDYLKQQRIIVRKYRLKK